jgi:2-oxoglutarate ferredoxin oxidoreductase subunit delta
MRATVTIDIETCKGCALCVPVCPPAVLSMSEAVNDKGYRYPELVEGCTGCELCAKVCPDYCFEVYREPAGARASGAPA